MGKRDIRDHFETIADEYDGWKAKNAYYHQSLKRFFSERTRPTDRVIEYGCGTGAILASVDGKSKVGLDISAAMIQLASTEHPDILFIEHDCETPYCERGAFDVAILADIIDHITDILDLYASVNAGLRLGGRMCISTVNPLWGPIFKVAEALNLKMPEGEHNFVPNRALIGLLSLRGFRFVSSEARLLFPKRIPLLSDWINRLAPRVPLLRRFCVVQTFVAEKVVEYETKYDSELSCAVIIPCLNESGNLKECVSRIPRMGAKTEIVVVDDGSTDDTADVAREIAKLDPRVRLVSYGGNKGKGHAVKQGFAAATCDIVMILDADMTVAPEELPIFFRAIAEGIGGFANGTRMIYPPEEQAMRFLNRMGNFFFGVVMSWLLSQRVSDTLCGTKALLRSDYGCIQMGNDKWGDFDLLFGAAENNLKIVEIPVHYKARVAGESKMRPFRHCLLLLKVCCLWFFRLKVMRSRART